MSKTSKLGDFIKIKHGYGYEGKYFKSDPPGDVLLTPGNFQIGGGFKAEKYKWYQGPAPEEFFLKENDLLVTMTDLSKDGDTLGYPALVPKISNIRFLHNQRLGKVEIKEDAPVIRDYLYYLLCTREYRNEILASATGSTVKHTSPERIYAFKFNLPPKNEQIKIARKLRAIDKKIEINMKINQYLELIAQAIFKSWFVDFDPVRAKAEGRDTGLPKEIADLFPSEFEDSELGRIPKGWKTGKLEDDFNITMGQSPPGKTYNENRIGLPFFQGRADFTFRYPENRVYCTEPTRFAETGDTLVSVRAPVGDINMAMEKCAIGRGVSAIRHKTSSRSFTYYLIKTCQEFFRNFEAGGTVFGSINKNDFLSINQIRIPNELVGFFEKRCFSIDQKIESNSKELVTLAMIRDLLISKLFR